MKIGNVEDLSREPVPPFSFIFLVSDAHPVRGIGSAVKFYASILPSLKFLWIRNKGTSGFFQLLTGMPTLFIGAELI